MPNSRMTKTNRPPRNPERFNPRKSIVIVVPQGLGDVIITFPTVHKILIHGYEVIYVVKDDNIKTYVESYFSGFQAVLFFIVTRGTKPESLLALIIELRRVSATYIVSAFGVSQLKFSLLALFSGASYRICFANKLAFLSNLIISPSGGHKGLEFSQVLKLLNIPSMEAVVFKSKGRNLESRRERVILVGPGSGSEESHKRWPHLHFSKLINLILDNYSARVLLLGDRIEFELCERILSSVDARHRKFVQIRAGEVPLHDFAIAVNGVDVAVTNCNGLSHLCASVGIPIIGIYGPTNWRITGPLSDQFVPIESRLSCSPCYRPGYTRGCGSPQCMYSIRPEAVYRELSKFLA